MHRRRDAVAVGLTALALAAGCSNGRPVVSAGSPSDSQRTDSQSTDSQSTDSQSTASESATGTASADTAGSGTPAPTGSAPTPDPSSNLAELPVLATRRTAAGDRAIRVDLNQVRASGQVLEVTFTARNTDPSGSSSNDRWQVSGFFGNGVYDAAGSSFSDADVFSADGVYVIDTVNAKRYLVARDANSVCVCSGNLAGTSIGPGQGVVLTATFRAPPPEVTTVDVAIPHAGTFAGVAVQR